MTDEIDQANEKVLAAQEEAIKAARRKVLQIEPIPTGRCLNCSKRVSTGRRWCDAACRDEYEAER
jgi:hypothetical protein